MVFKHAERAVRRYGYAAFLSYSGHDREWVQVLQQNLESILQSRGHDPWKIFLDKTDLGPGRSWLTGLQRGLDRSRRVILVATPESMASSWVESEWHSFVTRNRDWKDGRLLVVRAVDGPIPPFLKEIQRIDFRDHDDGKYRRGLQELAAGLEGKEDLRDLAELPDDLKIPPAPSRSVPADLRRGVVGWLEALLASCEEESLEMRGLLSVLDPDQILIRTQPSLELAASAMLVEHTGDDDPREALAGLLASLAKAVGGSRRHRKAAAQLAQLQERLEALRTATPGLDGLEQVWLRTVAQEHKDLMPYFRERGGADLLEQVHVQVEVAREEPRGSGDPAESPEPEDATTEARFRPAPLREVLARDPKTDSWITGRWVILGDPGAGKTTLLRHLALTLAEEALEEGQPARWVPVYASLPTWLDDRRPLPDVLEERLCMAGHPARGLGTRCDGWARAGRLLLLLDGLDEVVKENRPRAVQLLRDLALRWPDTPIVVASRPIGFESPELTFVELHVQPLDEERRRELLDKWLQLGDGRGPTADEALAILERDSNLRDMAGNPLLLTFMALLFAQGTTPSAIPAQLYAQIFDLLMEGEHRPAAERQPMEAPDVTRGILRRLAYGMTEDDLRSAPRGWFDGRLLDDDLADLRQKLVNHPRWKSSLRPFFDDLAERTGILGPHDGKQAEWRFWHRTFREALTAERLRERAGTEEGLAEICTQAATLVLDEDDRLRLAAGLDVQGDLARWAEPFALLAGQVPDPDGLVTTLVGANRELGLRALGGARGLRLETLETLLGELSDPFDRSRVFGAFPGAPEGAEGMLRRVDQLRQGTRDGDDLFWLYWVVQQVGERAGEAGESSLVERAQALLRDFFGHIPGPPADLFRIVETGKFGRVPLWCTIPPEARTGREDEVIGSFVMGSPEDEEGRFEWEGPRHRVEFRSRFRLAVVPVTRAQYALFDPEHQSYGFDGVPQEELAHHPVNEVSWWAAVSFCRWLSRSVPELAGARLPTEAEWEYACRAGTGTAYWTGDGKAALEKVGWYDRNSGGRTHWVGELPANPWGLFDVHGNVWEWTLDRPADYQKRLAGIREDPRGVDLEAAASDDPGGGGRVIRGGSYADVARDARSAFRIWRRPWYGFWSRGFRVALPAAPSEPRP